MSNTRPVSADDRAAHCRSLPSLDGLERLGAALGLVRPPLVLRRLGGGLGAATHLLDAGQARILLKRYPPGPGRRTRGVGDTSRRDRRLSEHEQASLDGQSWFAWEEIQSLDEHVEPPSLRNVLIDLVPEGPWNALPE